MADLKDFGLWTRRILALMVVGTFVYLAVTSSGTEVSPVLSLSNGLAGMVLGFYFGQALEAT